MNFSASEHRGKTRLNFKGILSFGLLVVVVLGIVFYIAFFSGSNDSSVDFPSSVTSSSSPSRRFDTEDQRKTLSPAFKQSSRNFNRQQEAQAAAKGEMVITSPLPTEIVSVSFKPEQSRRTVNTEPKSYKDTPVGDKAEFMDGNEFDAYRANAESMIKSWKLGGMEDDNNLAFKSLVIPTNNSSAVSTATSRPQPSALIPATKRQTKPAIQAGEFVYAVSMSAANSEVPAAIRFDLVGHPLGKAWVIANYTRRGHYLDIKATLLVLEGQPAVPINAVVTNMAGSPAMRNSVNPQYLKKYGITTIARIVQGFATAASLPSQIITVGSSNTTTVETQDLSFSDQTLAGVAEGAKAIADDLQKTAADVQPIVKLYANEPVSIFFLADVFVGGREK